MKGRKWKLALFVGRFQPFHKGHLYSLKKACEVGERVVVVVGSLQEEGTENNPFGFEIRKKMVECAVKEGGLEELVAGVYGVADFERDQEWVRRVGLVVSGFGCAEADCVVVGNNSWTNEVLARAGYGVFECGHYRRDELEGVKIREMMRAGDGAWEERVPGCVVRIINEQLPK